MQNSKCVCQVLVVDPDTQDIVEVEIRKLENSGGMVGLDGNWLDQSDENPTDPYDGKKFKVPDDELGTPVGHYDNIWNVVKVGGNCEKFVKEVTNMLGILLKESNTLTKDFVRSQLMTILTEKVEI